jgi:hypothetical protein
MMVVSQPDDAQASQATSSLAQHPEPETATPDAPGGRLASPAVQGGIAFLGYLIIWVASAFRPIISHATRMVLAYTSMDPNINVWSLRWWPYAIGNGLNPLYTHELLAPVGHSLAWVTTEPPLALLAAPLTLAAGPVVSFNLLAALAVPVSAWAAFILCRRLTGKFWAALAGGAVFGFSAYETYHSAMGQLNLAYSLLLPILGYVIVVWWQRRISTRTFVVLAAGILAVQLYLFLELFADLTAVLVISLVLGLALAGRPYRPVIVRLAKFIGLAYVIAIVLGAPYLADMLRTKPPRPVPASGTDLASLVIPQPGRTLGIAWFVHAASKWGPGNLSAACYVGIPLLVLVVLLAITSWRSRLVRFLCCMLVIIIAASLGPELYVDGRLTASLPWAGIFHLPLTRNAIPLRLMVFAYLILAVGVALWLAGPAKRAPWARWLLAVLVIVSIALDAAPVRVRADTEVPTFISAGQYRRQLWPGEVVVVVSNVGNAGMLWQAQSDFYMKIAGGYVNQGIGHGDLPRPMKYLYSPNLYRVTRFEDFIEASHVGAILVDAADAPSWVPLFRMIGLVGHLTGGVEVYPTDGCSACRIPDRAQLEKLRLSSASSA